MLRCVVAAELAIASACNKQGIFLICRHYNAMFSLMPCHLDRPFCYQSVLAFSYNPSAVFAPRRTGTLQLGSRRLGLSCTASSRRSSVACRCSSNVDEGQTAESVTSAVEGGSWPERRSVDRSERLMEDPYEPVEAAMTTPVSGRGKLDSPNKIMTSMIPMI